jgi:hypothetical protein
MTESNLSSRREFLKLSLGGALAIATSPIASFAQESEGKPHWNSLEKAFFSKYFLIPTYDSRVAYQDIPGEKLLKPLYEHYKDFYSICKRVTQDGTFHHIMPGLNPEFRSDFIKVKNSRPDFNLQRFEREMLEESAKIAPEIFRREIAKIKYLDPDGQPDEYIDRGVILMTEAEKEGLRRLRINELYKIRQLKNKEGEASEYTTKYGDLRMLIKDIEETAQDGRRVWFPLVRSLHDFETPRTPLATWKFMIMMQGLDGRYRVVNEKIPPFATDLKGVLLKQDSTKGWETSNLVPLKGHNEALFDKPDVVKKLTDLSVAAIAKRSTHLVVVPGDQFVIPSHASELLKAIHGKTSDGKFIYENPTPQDMAKFKRLVQPAVNSLKTKPRPETTVEMQREEQFKLMGGRKFP